VKIYGQYIGIVGVVFDGFTTICEAVAHERFGFAGVRDCRVGVVSITRVVAADCSLRVHFDRCVRNGDVGIDVVVG